MFAKIALVFALTTSIVATQINWNTSMGVRAQQPLLSSRFTIEPLDEEIKLQFGSAMSNLMGLIMGGSARSRSSTSLATSRSEPTVSSRSLDIAEPIAFKNSLVNFAAQKTSQLISLTPILLEALLDNAKDTGDEFIQNKIKSINGASKKLVSGVKTAGKLAVGLTVKGVQTAKKGVKVVGGLLLKPVFFVIGSKMKMLGTGLNVVGAKTKLVGSALKSAGKVIKAKGLGSVGFGATAIGWGTDTSTIPSVDTYPDEPLPQSQPQPQPELQPEFENVLNNLYQNGSLFQHIFN